MRLLLLSVLASCSIMVLGSPAPTHTTGTYGVDRVGGDLPNMPITLSISSPPEQCAQLCLDTPKCVAWSFQSAHCTTTSVAKHSMHDMVANHKLVQKGDTFIESAPWTETEYIRTSRQHYQQAQEQHAHSHASASADPKYSKCWLKWSISPMSPAPCHVTGIPHAYIESSTYQLFPVSSVTIPQGWLLQELQTQANGQAGHLHLFWADVQYSSWLGGFNDTGLHERLPYWLNAVTPMIYQLKHAGVLDVNTTALLGKIESFIEYVLAHQSPDGWLGPTDVYDPWSKMPLIMSLFAYIDEHPEMKNYVLDAIYRFLHAEMDFLLALVAHGGIGNWDWWSVRSQDIQISLLTLYYMDNGKNHIQRGETQFLMDISELLHALTFDWKPWFRYYMPPAPVTKNFNLTTHGVNSAMALKASAVWSRFSHDPDDVKGATDSVNRLYKYHGMSSGIFGCDEHLAGQLPQRGTELCTVVEAMFSFSTNMAILGDAQWGDRTESLMFNALPATMTPDLWAHQYLQQQNEVNAQVCNPHVWAADGPDSNIYGLAPNYGCCTANHGQGIPKYTSNMYMYSHDGPIPTIIASLYGPSILNVSDVTVTQTTNYPFCESPCSITFQITSNYEKTRFQFRIPEWARQPMLITPDGKHVLPTGSHWEYYDMIGSDVTLTLLLDMPLYVHRKEVANNAAAIYYGPLLLSMLINANITVLAQYAFNSQDLQMEPTDAWTYALKLTDDAHPEKDLTVHVAENIPQPYVFDPENPAIWVEAQGRLISWNMALNAAQTPPASPVITNSSLQAITLVPYGVSLLRISELPTCTN